MRQDLDVVVCVAIRLDLQGRDLGRGETILFQMRAGTEYTLGIIVF